MANFGYLGTPSKSIFSTYRQIFEKSSVNFLGEKKRNIVLFFELSISSGMRGVAVLQVEFFQNSWN